MNKRCASGSASVAPNRDICHSLATRLVGQAKVLIPATWPMDYGFILAVGTVGANPIVRIQSRCAYGDVFGSLHCDCRAQLTESARLITEKGGLIFYLEQEGRGAGLFAKASAYQAAEETQTDTFSHFESRGLLADPRDYRPVAEALRTLGLAEIELLTNNPAKVAAVVDVGIKVTRLPLIVDADPMASGYLNAKKLRGHQI